MAKKITPTKTKAGEEKPSAYEKMMNGGDSKDFKKDVEHEDKMKELNTQKVRPTIQKATANIIPMVHHAGQLANGNVDVKNLKTGKITSISETIGRRMASNYPDEFQII